MMCDFDHKSLVVCDATFGTNKYKVNVIFEVIFKYLISTYLYFIYILDIILTSLIKL